MTPKEENQTKEIEELKKIIEQIQQRNERVEKEKAWETSLTRKLVLVVLTYLTVVIFFWAAALPEPFINALVPSLAFILSTSSLPALKKAWLKRQRNQTK